MGLFAILIATPTAAAQTSDGSSEVMKRLEMLEKRLTATEAALKTRTSELTAAVARIDVLEMRSESDDKDFSIEPSLPEATAVSAEVLSNAVLPSEAQPPAPQSTNRVHDHNAVPAGATPRMTIRGFGDVEFGQDPYSATRPSFAFGQLDLYIVSKLASNTSVLMETVFEAGKDNAVGVDIERILLQQRINRYLRFEAGRNHTSIGYYNMAFHHGSWFQTATARPFLFAFEDEGGLLPIHSVGVRAAGDIPSERLGLEYVAEFGNGRSYEQGTEAVQNRINYNSGKSFNVAVSASPEGLPGLHLGASAYRETLKWNGLVPIQQKIFAAYAVYDRGHFEFLNEVLIMLHSQAARTTSIPGGYTQFAYRRGKWSPYSRFEYLNANSSDPVARLVLTNTGVRKETSAGIRYDFAEFAAIKLQYGRLFQTSLAPSNVAAAQLAFTF